MLLSEKLGTRKEKLCLGAQDSGIRESFLRCLIEDSWVFTNSVSREATKSQLFRALIRVGNRENLLPSPMNTDRDVQHANASYKRLYFQPLSV